MNLTSREKKILAFCIVIGLFFYNWTDIKSSVRESVCDCDCPETAQEAGETQESQERVVGISELSEQEQRRVRSFLTRNAHKTMFVRYYNGRLRIAGSPVANMPPPDDSWTVVSFDF